MAVVTSTNNPPVSPRFRTFSDLKRLGAAVANMVDDPEFLAAAGDGINLGIDQLNLHLWDWSLATYDITMVSGTTDYLVPGNFSAPRALEKLWSDGTVDGNMGYLEYKTFSEQYPSTSTGSPEAYTLVNASNDYQLSFNCSPSDTFVAQYPTLRLRYLSRLNHLIDDGDTLLGVPPEVELYLIACARCEVLERSDPPRATKYDNSRNEIMTLLRRKHQRVNVTAWSEQ